MNQRWKAAILLLLLTVGAGAIVVTMRGRRHLGPLKKEIAHVAAPKKDEPALVMPKFDPAPPPAPAPSAAGAAAPGAAGAPAPLAGDKTADDVVTHYLNESTIVQKSAPRTTPGEATDEERYPGIVTLKQGLQLTDDQQSRMIAWLKQRDAAYDQLAEIKDPTQHAAHGQSVRDSYERAFRSELTAAQQQKYEELQKSGSFSFRGPPAPPPAPAK